MELSIIIVNFNTKDVTRACLDSIKRWRGDTELETIVVDNGSTDGSVEMLDAIPWIRLIRNKKNLGFAKANNKGIRISKGKYILLLNSDTELRNGAIEEMLTFMDEHPRAGVSTCKLELTNGRMDPACHRGFPTPWASLTYFVGLEKLFPASRIFSRYHMGFMKLDVPHQVDVVSGAFFLARKTAINQVGLLDEDFFLYAEDIDWAYRFKQKGWEIWFNPKATVLHKKKVSGRASVLRTRKVQTEIYFHSNNWLFYKKHYAKRYGILITLAVHFFYTIRLFLLKYFSV